MKNYRNQEYWDNEEREKTILRNKFGNAINEITNEFYTMNSSDMGKLLKIYGNLHGWKAENYARETIPKWRSGQVKPSSQTLKRLIDLVPPYLSPEKRFKILEIILNKYGSNPQTQHITVNAKEPDEGLGNIDKALRNIAVTDELAYLPTNVMDTAKWLYDDDITTARAMLSRISAEKTKLLKESAIREINLLKRGIQSGKIESANYNVSTPGGNLEISVSTPSFCFIATACFGNTDPRTNVLRSWRDNTLKHYFIGRCFIAWYYRNGPTLSHFFTSNHIFLFITRFSLTCFVMCLQTINNLLHKITGDSHV